jgi:hypothetical protein
MKVRAVLFVTLLAAAPLHAGRKYQANRYDLRTVTTTAEGTSPDGPIKTTLVVQYSPGKNGTMSLQFIVTNSPVA